MNNNPTEQRLATEPRTVDPLAELAVAPIESGMIVGLGTGRTASRGIRALADRVKDEGLNIECVSTSEASERLAADLGLRVVEFATKEHVDYLFDGADEIDSQMRMLKGAGGAVTRERMVAWASERCVYLVQENKVVERVGSNASLPIAVMAFGLASIRKGLRHLGLNGVLRRTMDGQLFITDNGNLILDVTLRDEGHDLEELAINIERIPGVIDHGLFLHEADEILVEDADGRVKTRLVRSDVP